MSNIDNEEKFPLGISDTSAAETNSYRLMEKLRSNTLGALDMNSTELSHLPSDTATGTLIKISTLLNAGFVITWWGPEAYSDNLTDVISAYGSYLAQRIRNTILSGDEQRGSAMWVNQERREGKQ